MHHKEKDVNFANRYALRKLLSRYKNRAQLIMIDAKADGVKPDVTIGGKEAPYLQRWWLGRTPQAGDTLSQYTDVLSGPNAYLHCLRLSDPSIHKHDHPWDSASLLLEGEYIEEMFGLTRISVPGDVTYRDAEDVHRIQVATQEVWSLFVTLPKRREWGFLTRSGWIHNLAYQYQQQHGDVVAFDKKRRGL